jgi:hypothetical protein
MTREQADEVPGQADEDGFGADEGEDAFAGGAEPENGDFAKSGGDGVVDGGHDGGGGDDGHESGDDQEHVLPERKVSKNRA